MKLFILISFVNYFMMGQLFTEKVDSASIDIRIENLSNINIDKVTMADGELEFTNISSKSISNNALTNSLSFFSPIAISANGNNYIIASSLQGNGAKLPPGKYTYQINISEKEQKATLNFMVH